MRFSRALHLAVCCGVLLGAGTAYGELVTNGDFQSGGIGFGSQYTFALGNSSSGEMTVGTLPDAWGSESFINPTSAELPAGNQMLVANGSTNVFDRVWYQTIDVTKDLEYDVSFMGASLTASSPSKLRFYASLDPLDPIAAQAVATVTLTGATGIGAWVEGTGSFIAEHTGSITVFISDLVTSASGNNFALDDISVTQVPEPSSLALLGIGSLVGLGVYRRRRRA